MLVSLTVGLPAIIACLWLQALVVALCLRQYVGYRNRLQHPTLARHIRVLAVLMLMMLLGTFLQMGLWALLFVFLGEFDNFHQALYFSGVTFATLGYGDVVLSTQWQLLGPLEAANGVLMLGVSTAVMTAAVGDLIKRYALHRDG